MGVTSERLGEDRTLQPAGEEWAEGLTRDELFHVLRNRRRRFAIHYLKRAGRPVDVGDLATQVAAWENGISTEAVTSKQRRRVYNALQQTHLSELHRSGLVEVDQREVELTDAANRLDIYLEIVPGGDVPWSEYYLAIAGVGVATVVAVGLDVGPFAALPDIAVGVFLAVVLAVSACANYYYQHENLLSRTEKPPELRT